MSRQGVSIRKINSSILKIFNKHQEDLNNVCQSKQELLNLIFGIYKDIFVLLIQANQ